MGVHRGKWVNFATDERGDICDLIQWKLALSPSKALRWIHDWCGGNMATPERGSSTTSPAALQNEAAEKERNTRLALAIFEGALPLMGTPGLDYLQKRMRGLLPQEIATSDALRFSASCRKMLGEPVKGAIGAMIAIMTDPASGAPTGCHRTYIDRDLKRIQRGALGRTGVVRLTQLEQSNRKLSIGEGIESSIAGSILLGTGAAVYSGISAGGLSTFPVISGVEHLTIFSDNDHNQTGQRSAKLTFNRWRDAGVSATLHVPFPGHKDFNNVLETLVDGSGP